jgi:ketosteroid isomerase-like protein
VDPNKLEILERFEDAWNRGDIEALLEMFPLDVEWVIAQENPEARTLRGKEEVGAYFADWRATVDALRFEATEYVEAGDAVVTIGSASGQVGAGGPELRVALCFVTRFEHGLPARTEEYLDAQRALAAAGVG